MAKAKIYLGYKNAKVAGETRKATLIEFAGGREVWFADAMDWQFATVAGERMLLVEQKLAGKKAVEAYACGEFVKNAAGDFEACEVVPAPEFPGPRFDATADDAHTRMGGRGYNRDGFWVSNNSLAAREAGCHPASDIDAMFKFPAGFTAWAFDVSEWHHTSSYYNKVYHYSADKIKKWMDENPETLKQALKIFKAWKKASK